MLVKGSLGLSEVTRGKLSPAIEGDQTAEARMRLESHYVQLH
jgi:hypothetical protein